ncbi:hypothetical protein A3715_12445 [Oleiphilus sp. HI0009]|uniref:GFA family protein n=1 Tax=unclassified Oleiphilus TaxID=2631174 RepID=UPI0007C2E3A2|nr:MULTISPECIES: GFA family protein [unclassified Oleiphilus]KZX76839.1 hypothetical protein A3715_12445 [Oleiphilus sp. HI0009]MCH2159997.1 GFA family protein [Oleiphilaceae bacterium]KZY64895.1 hypothetical protein A3738_09920 [Oleiphilus sp. HI0066]KZY68728.1 hypothetical protein A3739_10550 [Oleiphilus sp. HI0067]KZY70763.1 hypothetical protein A3739_17540 [Oleiphilus sp. HI0067]
MSHQCSCPCGKTKFTVEKTPAVRFFCHCEICQALYKSNYSDVCVVKSKHVTLDEQDVEFKTYRLPPALQRGTCKHCHLPVAGFLKGIPGLGLAFISAENFDDKSSLPDAVGHVFYHRKSASYDDKLEKHEGYWGSQLAICRWVMPKLLQMS